MMGKPKTKEIAKEMLEALSGNSHRILTGLAVMDSKTNKVVTAVSEACVHFHEMSEKEIDDYIQTGEPLDRAGAYAIQGGASNFIKKLEGDYDSVVGLPLDQLIEILRHDFGVGISRK